MSLDSLTTQLRQAGMPVAGLALVEPNTEYAGGYVEMTSMGQVKIYWERTPTALELQSVYEICRADAQQESVSVIDKIKRLAHEAQWELVLQATAITIQSNAEAFPDLCQ